MRKVKTGRSKPELPNQYSKLTATMETTPQEDSLNTVPAEANAIKEIVTTHRQVTHREQSDAESVLHSMSNHDMFHFAGLRVSYAVDPARSCLIFEKAEASPMLTVQDRLQVQRLFEVNLRPALPARGLVGSVMVQTTLRKLC